MVEGLRHAWQQSDVPSPTRDRSEVPKEAFPEESDRSPAQAPHGTDGSEEGSPSDDPAPESRGEATQIQTPAWTEPGHPLMKDADLLKLQRRVLLEELLRQGGPHPCMKNSPWPSEVTNHRRDTL